MSARLREAVMSSGRTGMWSLVTRLEREARRTFAHSTAETACAYLLRTRRVTLRQVDWVAVYAGGRPRK